MTVIGDQTQVAQAALKTMPSYDISNEKWRQYIYPVVGTETPIVFRVERAKTLILDKREDGDRHRLILDKDDGTESGLYVVPGWIAIEWQDHEGKHGITF